MFKGKIYLLSNLMLFIVGVDFAHAKGISARSQHTAIYDSAGKQMIVFGGENEKGVLNDTWAFDIEKKAWEEIKAAEEGKIPSARRYHSAIYDENNKQMIVFSGGDATNRVGLFFDTWTFNIGKNTWEEIETDTIPPARIYHSAVYDPINKQMIVFGGGTRKAAFSDIWVYDIESLQDNSPDATSGSLKKAWTEVETKESPSQRIGHSAVYDSTNKQMIIFGGDNRGRLNDTWLYNIETKTWTEIDIKKRPPARFLHSAIYDPENKEMIIFGGIGKPGELRYSDTWALNIEKKEWREIKAMKNPSFRYGHSAVYDSTNKQMIIFGGRGLDTKYIDETWTFDIAKKTWAKIRVRSEDSPSEEKAQQED